VRGAASQRLGRLLSFADSDGTGWMVQEVGHKAAAAG
jgi:hypothetical protein